MKKFWNFKKIKNDTGETGNELTLYGEISEETWWGDETTPEQFRSELSACNGDITVKINSPGGDVFAANRIYNMLKEHNGKISVKIDALAASAATVVAMAGDEIYISPVGMMMIHNPSTIAMGDHKDMAKAIDILNEVKENIINAYEEKTRMSRKELSELMDAETWMNAKKALELGFVDGFLYSEDEKKSDTESEPTPEEPKEHQDTETPADAFSVKSSQKDFIKKIVKAEKKDRKISALLTELYNKIY